MLLTVVAQESTTDLREAAGAFSAENGAFSSNASLFPLIGAAPSRPSLACAVGRAGPPSKKADARLLARRREAARSDPVTGNEHQGGLLSGRLGRS
jgi:hypothetical protein